MLRRSQGVIVLHLVHELFKSVTSVCAHEPVCKYGAAAAATSAAEQRAAPHRPSETRGGDRRKDLQPLLGSARSAQPALLGRSAHFMHFAANFISKQTGFGDTLCTGRKLIFRRSFTIRRF